MWKDFFLTFLTLIVTITVPATVSVLRQAWLHWGNVVFPFISFHWNQSVESLWSFHPAAHMHGIAVSHTVFKASWWVLICCSDCNIFHPLNTIHCELSSSTSIITHAFLFYIRAMCVIEIRFSLTPSYWCISVRELKHILFDFFIDLKIFFYSGIPKHFLFFSELLNYFNK